jgi:IS30 family transposase
MDYGVAMPMRSYRHMSAEERETVSLGLAQGHALRELARCLGRSPSTVSREVARNVTRSRSSLSAAAPAETLGSLAVTVRAEPPG